MLPPKRKSLFSIEGQSLLNPIDDALSDGLSERARQLYNPLATAGFRSLSDDLGLRLIQGEGYGLVETGINPIAQEQQVYQNLMAAYVTNKITIDDLVLMIQDNGQKLWGNADAVWKSNSNPLYGRVNEQWFRHLISPGYKFRPEHIIPILITSDLLPTESGSLTNQLNLTVDPTRRAFLDQYKVPLLPNGAFWYVWALKVNLLETHRTAIAEALGSNQNEAEQINAINTLLGLPVNLDWMALESKSPAITSTHNHRDGSPRKEKPINLAKVIDSKISVAELQRATDILQHLWSNRLALRGHKSAESDNVHWMLHTDIPEVYTKTLEVLGHGDLINWEGTVFELDEVARFLASGTEKSTDRSQAMDSVQVKRIVDAFGISAINLEKIMNRNHGIMASLDDVGKEETRVLGYVFADSLCLISASEMTIRVLTISEEDRRRTLGLILKGVWQKISLTPNRQDLVVTREDNRRFILPNHPWNMNTTLPPTHALVPVEVPIGESISSHQRMTLLSLLGRSDTVRLGINFLNVRLPEPPYLIRALDNEALSTQEYLQLAAEMLETSIRLFPYLHADALGNACDRMQDIYNASRRLSRLPHITTTLLAPNFQALENILEPWLHILDVPLAANHHITLDDFFSIVDEAVEFINVSYKDAEIQRKRQEQVDALNLSIDALREQIGCVLDELHGSQGLGPIVGTVLTRLSPHAHGLLNYGVLDIAGRILNPYGDADVPCDLESEQRDNISKLQEIERLFKGIDADLRKLAEESNSAGLRTALKDAADRNSKRRYSARQYISRAERTQEDILYCREVMEGLGITVTAVAAFMEDYFGRKALPVSRVEEILQPTATHTDVAASEVRKILHIIHDIQIGKLRVQDHGHNIKEIVCNPTNQTFPLEKPHQISIVGNTCNVSPDFYGRDLIYVEINGISRVVNMANGIPHTEQDRLAALNNLQKQLLPVLNGLGAIIEMEDIDRVSGVVQNIASHPTLFDPAIIDLAQRLLGFEGDDPDTLRQAQLLGLREIHAELKRIVIGAKPLNIRDISLLVDPSKCASQNLEAFIPIENNSVLQTEDRIRPHLNNAKGYIDIYGISKASISQHLERTYGRGDIPASGYKEALNSNRGISLARQVIVIGRVLRVLSELERGDLQLGNHHNGNQELLFSPNYLDQERFVSQFFSIRNVDIRFAVEPRSSTRGSICLYVEAHGNIQTVTLPRNAFRPSANTVQPAGIDVGI